MNYKYIFFLIAIMAVRTVLAIDLSSVLTDTDFWKQDGTALSMTLRGSGFHFSDNSRKELVSSKFQQVKFGGYGVYDSRIFFNEELPNKITLYLYNKGDAVSGFVTKEDFGEMVEDISGKVNTAFGYSYTTGKTEKLDHDKFVQSRRWTRSSVNVQLEWAYEKGKRFLPEYLRLIIVPKSSDAANDSALLSGKGIRVRAKTKSALRKDIIRSGKGDVYIDSIPMVDQEQKGYCAVTTAERILRHYGLMVDQHKMAMLADTSAQGGTSFDAFAKAVSSVAKEFDLKEKVLIEPMSEIAELKDEIERYNKAVKKAKKTGKIKPVKSKYLEEIDMEDYKVQVNERMYTIDVMAILRSYEPAVYLLAQQEQKQHYAAFQRDIFKSIDEGVPLFWSCLVGIYPEIPDVGNGIFGHIRLIIGYNKQKKEILYSDSWGAGHELKRMPVDQAWAITRGLNVLMPKL